MKNIKISIIVPVYNASHYLRECIESLINQTYKNIELILVNDGSTDNSLTICNEYQKKDKRIIVIDQKNSGVSVARNNGIQKSSGEYLIFVDSDDYCELNMIEKIIPEISKNKLVILGYNKFYRNNSIICQLEEPNINTDNILHYVLYNMNVGGYLWNKVFSSEIIKKKNIYFNKNIHLCEDLVFVIDYLQYINEISYINCPLYNYRMRKSGASSDIYNKKSVSILDAYNYLINNYKSSDILSKYLHYNYILNFYKFKKYIPKDYKINFEIIKNERKIIKDNKLDFREKITFFLMKRCNILYRTIREIKQKKLKFFD